MPRLSDERATTLERVAAVVILLACFAPWSFGDTGYDLIGYDWHSVRESAFTSVPALWSDLGPTPTAQSGVRRNANAGD